MQPSATMAGPGMALSPATQRRTVRASTPSWRAASSCDQPSAAMAAANLAGSNGRAFRRENDAAMLGKRLPRFGLSVATIIEALGRDPHPAARGVRYGAGNKLGRQALWVERGACGGEMGHGSAPRPNDALVINCVAARRERGMGVGQVIAPSDHQRAIGAERCEAIIAAAGTNEANRIGGEAGGAAGRGFVVAHGLVPSDEGNIGPMVLDGQQLFCRLGRIVSEHRSMTPLNHARGPFLATLEPVARLGGRDGAGRGCIGFYGAQNGFLQPTARGGALQCGGV